MLLKICKDITVDNLIKFYDECRKIKDDDSELTLDIEHGVTPDFVALFLNTLRELYSIKSIFFATIPSSAQKLLTDKNFTWEIVSTLKLNVLKNNLSQEHLMNIAECGSTNVITLDLEALGDNT